MFRRIASIAAVLAFSTAASAAADPTPPPIAPDLPTAAPAQSPLPDMPAATATPAAVPKRIDGAYSLPGGVWSCETLANSEATSVYKLVSPREITEKTLLHLPNRAPVELDTVFSYDEKADRWSLSMQHGAYTASAGPWSSAEWVLMGNEADAVPRRVVRLVYTSLGPDAYRSDYQAQSNAGRWATFSGATCKRTQP